MTGLPRVAVFDAELPPSLAIARSLGRRGVPIVAYSTKRFDTTKLSRHVADRRSCPSVHDADAFVEWLVHELEADRFDLIALTSDYLAFNAMEAYERVGRMPRGYPTAEAVRTCLFKDEFASAMEAAGFPVPPTLDTDDLDEAHRFGRTHGFPLVAKPRSHAGIGLARGAVSHDRHDLADAFESHELDDGQDVVRRRSPRLARPLLQPLLDGPDHEVVSVTGVLDSDGTPLAVGHNRKLGRWPGRLGVGTIFEVVGRQPFTDHAVETVRTVLGAGIFELEVVVHRPSGDYWAIDLNPRAYGQIALDIGAGHDYPGLWYGSVTGIELPAEPRRRRPPTFWHQGVPVWAAAGRRIVHGPDRVALVRQLVAHQRTPHVGSVAELSDPLPALPMAWSLVRHPRSLFRTTADGVGAAVVDSDETAGDASA